MTQRILLLSPFFHPEPIATGRYNSFLVKALVQKGVCVDVICFHPLYPGWRPNCCDEGLPGVGIHRGGKWLRYPKSMLLRRAVLECGFLIYLLRHARRINGYSRIVAVLPPILFLPLVRMAAKPEASVIALVHDLQGIMAGVNPGRGHSIVAVLVRYVEALMLKCCHRVIAISSGMADWLSETYRIPYSKIAVCRPFVTVRTRRRKRRLDHLFAREKKHVVYAGALGEKHNPEALIAFFRHLVSRRPGVDCHVVSGGPIFEALKRDSAGNDRLMFHDLIPDQDLYELYLRSHIQVVPQKIGFSNGAFPSKLPNLLASGTPVLYIGEKNSDARRVIQAAGAGLCTDSWDPAELKALVDRLLIEAANRSHADRRLVFEKRFAALFSTEPLVGELIGRFHVSN